MKKLLIALLIIISLPLLASAGTTTPGPLPEIFAPLSWEMDIKELKKLFPSAEHFETAYTSPENEKMISSMVFGFKWEHFGEAHVGVSHHDYKRIDIIGISTTERRPECFESLPAPKWCRTSYSDELVNTLEDIKKIITKAYGPPLEYEGGYREAAGLPPDSREKGNKWELDGYNLFLTITVGEEEDWAVGLQAVRREDAATQEIGWVGLWNEEMTKWAENENQINRLCPKSMSQDSNEKCRKNNLAEKSWTIEAYRSPGNTSEKVGEILITVKPGSSFVASFKDNAGTIRNFETDLYDQDWGYGPLFHQTLLDKKEDWIQIPIKSLDTPVWINPKDNIEYLDIITIAEGHVYLLDGESIVITKKEGDTLFFRKEQPSDMWCYEGNPPKLKASEIKRINVEQLYDSHKHLMLDIKYKRGC